MATTTATGSCLCGAVNVTAKAALGDIGACHCDTCRNWGGGPYLSVDCASSATFTGEEYIAVFQSSQWAERAFCKQCGTHLYYRLKQNNQYMLPAGLLDPAEGLSMSHQVFIDEKPHYYAFSGDTKNFTGEEIFELFGANANGS
ncbi:MAG: GFA family protein [Pseudomonadota bacterium]